jgi:hypothetical protein
MLGCVDCDQHGWAHDFSGKANAYRDTAMPIILLRRRVGFASKFGTDGAHCSSALAEVTSNPLIKPSGISKIMALKSNARFVDTTFILISIRSS